MGMRLLRFIVCRAILAGAGMGLLLIGVSPRGLAETPPVTGRSAALVDVAASSSEARDPGHDFLVIRKAVAGPFQSLVNSTRPSFVLDDFAGQTVEIAGRVAGKATLDTGVMLIIETRAGSINVSVASDNDWQWLDTGSTLRALVAVPDAATIAALRSIVPMIASAPEGAVEQAERDEAAALQQAAVAAAAKAAQRARASGGTASRSARYDARADYGGGHPIARLSQAALSVYGPYRAFVSRSNSHLTPLQVDTITTSILFYSEYEKLDPRLVIAMILAESNFDPYSTSRTGAMGLSQLMPGTAAGLGVADAYDPVQNIGAAVHILSSHVKSYGGATAQGLVPINTLILTMAAYNAGSGAVHRYQGVPPYRETRRYVRKVASLYKRICGL
ncbi:MAG: lytic transglycosylase domain-containing protein [Capsulimonadaceae bacterium]|nr:lytic transglycosylase domain-containing protein [Capsulimonadaceae bacterium]